VNENKGRHAERTNSVQSRAIMCPEEDQPPSV